jgi:hypothetical protein
VRRRCGRRALLAAPLSALPRLLLLTAAPAAKAKPQPRRQNAGRLALLYDLWLPLLGPPFRRPARAFSATTAATAAAFPSAPLFRQLDPPLLALRRSRGLSCPVISI